MRKIISVICIVVVLLGSNTTVFFAAQNNNYNITLNNNIYEHGDYLIANINVPDDIDLAYSIEVLKGGDILAVIQNNADQKELKFPIPYHWKYGDDYVFRAGRGEVFSSVNFEIGNKTYLLDATNSNKTVFQGDKLVFKGGSNANKGTIKYFVSSDNSSFKDKTVEIQLNNKEIEFAINIDNSYPAGNYKVKVGHNDIYSNEVNFTVGEVIPKVQKLTASPTAGQISSGTKITLTTATSGAAIHYTTDGSTPTRSSKVYIEPINITSDTTIKAFAVKEGYLDSDLLEQKYTIKSTDNSGTGGEGGGGGSTTVRYDVSFETNGGSSVKNQSVLSNSTVNKPGNPVKKGFIFTGWYSDSKLTVKYDFSSKVTSNLTLYAGWEKEAAEEQKEQIIDDKTPLSVTEPELISRFSDIKGHWAEEIINEIASQEIVSGYPDGTFRPDATITRAEFVKMAVDALEFELNDEAKVFEDVKDSDWFKKCIDIGVSNGLAQGISDTLFNPNANVTRQDICVIMFNAMIKLGVEMPQTENNEFSDLDLVADYAKDAVHMLKQLKIISGRENNVFDPAASATRAESAKIIFEIISFINSR